MLLNDRLVDPEEVLFNLGFGGPQPVAYVPSLARIPQRFLQAAASRAAVTSPGEDGCGDLGPGLGFSSPEECVGSVGGGACGTGGSGGMAGSGLAAAVQAMQQGQMGGMVPNRKRTGGFYVSGVLFLPCHGYVDLARLVRDYNIPLVFFNREGSKCYRRVRLRGNRSVRTGAAEDGAVADGAIGAGGVGGNVAVERRRSSRRSKRTIRRRKTGGKSMHQSRSWIESVEEEEVEKDSEINKENETASNEDVAKSTRRRTRKSAGESTKSDQKLFDVTEGSKEKLISEQPMKGLAPATEGRSKSEVVTNEQKPPPLPVDSIQDSKHEPEMTITISKPETCKEENKSVSVTDLSVDKSGKNRRKKFFDLNYVKMAAKKLGDAMTGKLGKSRERLQSATADNQTDHNISDSTPERAGQDKDGSQIVLEKVEPQYNEPLSQSSGTLGHAVGEDLHMSEDSGRASTESPKLDQKSREKGLRISELKQQVHTSHPNLVSKLCMAPILGGYVTRWAGADSARAETAETAEKLCQSDSALNKGDLSHSADGSPMDMSPRCHSLEPEERPVVEDHIFPNVSSFAQAVSNSTNTDIRLSNPSIVCNIDIQSHHVSPELSSKPHIYSTTEDTKNVSDKTANEYWDKDISGTLEPRSNLLADFTISSIEAKSPDVSTTQQDGSTKSSRYQQSTSVPDICETKGAVVSDKQHHAENFRYDYSHPGLAVTSSDKTGEPDESVSTEASICGIQPSVSVLEQRQVESNTQISLVGEDSSANKLPLTFNNNSCASNSRVEYYIKPSESYESPRICVGEISPVSQNFVSVSSTENLISTPEKQIYSNTLFTDSYTAANEKDGSTIVLASENIYRTDDLGRNRDSRLDSESTQSGLNVEVCDSSELRKIHNNDEIVRGVSAENMTGRRINDDDEDKERVKGVVEGKENEENDRVNDSVHTMNSNTVNGNGIKSDETGKDANKNTRSETSDKRGDEKGGRDESDEAEATDVAPAGSLGPDTHLDSGGGGLVPGGVLSLLGPSAGGMEFLLSLSLPGKDEEEDNSSEVSSEYGHTLDDRPHADNINTLEKDGKDLAESFISDKMDEDDDEGSDFDDYGSEFGDEDDFVLGESGDEDYSLEEVSDEGGEFEEGVAVGKEETKRTKDECDNYFKYPGWTTNEPDTRRGVAVAYGDIDNINPSRAIHSTLYSPSSGVPLSHTISNTPHTFRTIHSSLEFLDKTPECSQIDNQILGNIWQHQQTSGTPDISFTDSQEISCSFQKSFSSTSLRTIGALVDFRALDGQNSTQRSARGNNGSSEYPAASGHLGSLPQLLSASSFSLASNRSSSRLSSQRPSVIFGSPSPTTALFFKLRKTAPPSSSYPSTFTPKPSTSCSQGFLIGRQSKVSLPVDTVVATTSSTIEQFYKDTDAYTKSLRNVLSAGVSDSDGNIDKRDTVESVATAIKQNICENVATASSCGGDYEKGGTIKHAESVAIENDEHNTASTSVTLKNVETSISNQTEVDSFTPAQSTNDGKRPMGGMYVREEMDSVEIEARPQVVNTDPKPVSPVKEIPTSLSLANRKRQERKTMAFDPRAPGRKLGASRGFTPAPLPEDTSADYDCADSEARSDRQLPLPPDVDARRQSLLLRRRTSTGCITARQNAPPALASSSSAEWAWLLSSRRPVEGLDQLSPQDQADLDMSNVSTSSDEDSESDSDERREGEKWGDIFERPSGSVIFGL